MPCRDILSNGIPPHYTEHGALPRLFSSFTLVSTSMLVITVTSMLLIPSAGSQIRVTSSLNPTELHGMWCFLSQLVNQFSGTVLWSCFGIRPSVCRASRLRYGVIFPSSSEPPSFQVFSLAVDHVGPRCPSPRPSKHRRNVRVVSSNYVTS